MNRVAGPNQGDDLQSWFREIPFVTKLLTVSTFLCALGMILGIVNTGDLLLLWEKLRYKFEIWRLFTPLVYAGPFSFPFAMHLVLLYQTCKRYESNPFNTGAGGNSADFLWMFILCGGIEMGLAYVFEFLAMSEAILYTIMYVWTRRDPTSIVNFFGGFKFQALYLPWVYMAMKMVMGGSLLMPLIGVAVGHLYFFAVSVLPDTHGFTLITTPRFCISIVDWYTGYGVRPAASFSGNRPAVNGGAQGAGHAWGRGRVLGAPQ